jgi:glycosyltransferase involved in cell wall biosynthesis
MKYSHTIVVCSRDRSLELLEFLEAISSVTYFSNVKIILVENSASAENYQAVKVKIDNDSKFREITLIQSPPGLARARNAALPLISGDIVHFMDDDICLPTNYFEVVDQTFSNNPQTGGLAPFIQTSAILSESIIKRLLRHIFQRDGKLLRSGRARWLSRSGKNYQVNWLPGCCMVYRTSKIQGLRFETKLEKGPLGGYALGEDLDFSHRVSKHTKLLGLGEISIFHKLAPNDRTNWIKMDEGIGRLRAFLLVRFPEEVKISRVLLSLSLEGLIDLMRIRITKRKTVSPNYRQFARLRSFFEELDTPKLGNLENGHED